MHPPLGVSGVLPPKSGSSPIRSRRSLPNPGAARHFSVIWAESWSLSSLTRTFHPSASPGGLSLMCSKYPRSLATCRHCPASSPVSPQSLDYITALLAGVEGSLLPSVWSALGKQGVTPQPRPPKASLPAVSHQSLCEGPRGSLLPPGSLLASETIPHGQ